jgi:hypothetical protein
VREVKARAALGAAAIAVLLGLAVGCGSDDDGDTSGTDATSTIESSDDTTVADGIEPSAELTSYDSIAALHAELVANDVACGLEYEGLRDAGKEVSICVIEGEQALLTIWDDPSLVDEFVDSEVAADGNVAAGANWTVDVDSPAVAQTVAGALGGIATGS